MEYDTYTKIKFLLELANTWGHLGNHKHQELLQNLTHHGKTITVQATINGDTNRYSLNTLVKLATHRNISMSDITDSFDIQWDSVK